MKIKKINLLRVGQVLLYRSLWLWEHAKRIIIFLFWSKKSSPFSARWQTRLEEMKVLSSTNRGFPIDGQRKLKLRQSFNHGIIFGGTGSGKSSSLIIPWLQDIDYSCVVLDVGNELWTKTSCDLRNRGFDLRRIDLSKPMQSEGINILGLAKSDDEIQRVAHALLHGAFRDGKGGDPFWEVAGVQLMSNLIKMLKTAPRKYFNIANVRNLLINLNANPDCPTRLWAMKHIEDKQLYDEFLGCMAGSSTKATDSIIMMCKTALSSISSKELGIMTSKDTFDYATLRDNKIALFISIKEVDLEMRGFLVACILGRLFSISFDTAKYKNVPPPPLAYILDEAGNLNLSGGATKFSSILSTLRKHSVTCLQCIQSRSQLVSIYSKSDAESILTTVGTHIIMPGLSNHQHLSEISQLLGREMRGDENRAISAPLMSPHELYTLTGKAVVLLSQHLPCLVKLKPYYKDKQRLKRSQLPEIECKKRRKRAVELISLTK